MSRPAAAEALDRFIAGRLQANVPPAAEQAARAIGQRLGGDAVLFYGSVLRTGDLDGLLDFYVLTPAARSRGVRALASRYLWPDISFDEVTVGAEDGPGRTIRAKVAAMPLDLFEAAAAGHLHDTTIWTRFVQPAALVWVRGERTRARTVRAVGEAAKTAARFAAVLGPERGRAGEYWQALFQETYRAELRVEPPGRAEQITRHVPADYAQLLPLAWSAAGVAFSKDGGTLRPQLDPGERADLLKRWRTRRRLGKPLNAARLVKAAFTLEGAARYGLWKVERHTGVAVRLTPWRERHPILAAPGVFWRVWRSSGRA